MEIIFDLPVDFHKRWDPAAIFIYNKLKSSKGYPIRAYMNMDDIIDVPTEWFKWGGSSDPVDFLGVHCVDLMRWYMDCEAVDVWICFFFFVYHAVWGVA